MTKDARLWIKDITDEGAVRGSYLVKQKTVGTTRKGDLFISLTLADRTGEVDGKIWKDAEQMSSRFQKGDVCEVEGYAGSYRGRIQITVSGIKALKEETDPSIFLESAQVDPSEMMKSLRGILREVKNGHLRRLIERFLGDQRFVSLFKSAPAAKSFHHNYLGGLLEHTLSVCQMSKLVAEHYPQLDRDLLLTATFLHDIGKIKELRLHPHMDYTDEGRLVGHLVLGTAMLDEKLGEIKGFPQEMAIRLKHLILSHHGQYEFGSPKVPKFLEAIALNLIDDLDAKINGLSRFMERDRQEGAWTEFNRLLERYFLKGEILPVEEESDEGEQQAVKQENLFSQ
jgi:3'-5' exoribonuclease